MKIRGIRGILVVLLWEAVGAPWVLADPDATGSSAYEPALAAVLERDCRAWVEFLASEELEGRESGQRGHDLACRYVSSLLQILGVDGLAGSYFQDFSVVRRELVADDTVLTLRTQGGDTERVFLEGEIGLRSAGSVHWKGPWVCSGYGETIGGRGSDELFGPDQTVLVVAPRGKQDAVVRAAVAAGVRRLAIVSDDHVKAKVGADFPPAELEYQVDRQRARDATAFEGVDTVYLTSNLADRILEHFGTTVAAMRSSGESAAGFVLDGLELELRVELRDTKIATRNVVGVLEGRDPRLKDQFVLVGAHLDHIGAEHGAIFHGADDNASGSSVVLGVAKALASLARRPRRSVAFLFFGAEEQGLLGSRYFVDHSPIPLGDVVLMINLDMVGRHEEGPDDRPEDNVDSLHVIGSQRLSRELDPWIQRLNRRVGFEFEYDLEDVAWSRSDHWNFGKRRIPVVFFFSGFHPDYHESTDTANKVDYGKVVRVCQLVLALAYEVADRPRRLTINRF